MAGIRPIVVASIAALGAAVLLTPPVRHTIADLMHRGLNRYQRQHAADFFEVRALHAAGRHEEAAKFAETLIAEHGATHIGHVLGDERAELMRIRADSLRALGKKRRTFEQYDELIALQPRHLVNHVRSARASAEFGDRARARTGYLGALALEPYNLESAEGLVRVDFEGGDFVAATASIEAFADALVVARVHLAYGGHEVARTWPVDGKAHRRQLSWPSSPASTDAFVVRLEKPHDVELTALTFYGPRRVGRPGRRSFTVALDRTRTSTVAGVPRVEVPIAEGIGEVAAIEVELVLRRQMSCALDDMARRSFESTLRQATWTRLRERFARECRRSP